MVNLADQIDELKEKISVLQQSMSSLLKYKGHRFYKERYDDALVEADKSFKLLKRHIFDLGDEEISSSFSKIEQELSSIWGKSKYDEKLASIKNLRILWNDLEVIIKGLPVGAEKPKLNLQKVPKEVINEVQLDLEEALRCIDAKAFRSSIIMAARSLEVCLHRKYFEATGTDLFDSGIGIGKLIGKLKEEKVSLTPGVNQVFNLANDCRIHSVHKKKNIFLPKDSDALSILQLVNNCIERLW